MSQNLLSAAVLIGALRANLLISQPKHMGHRVFYGVESWSGVLELSIGVEWRQILEWQK